MSRVFHRGEIELSFAEKVDAPQTLGTLVHRKMERFVMGMVFLLTQPFSKDTDLISVW